MIGYLEGTVIANDDRGVVILTRSGVGYLVLAPRTVKERAGLDSELALWVHTVVREDALDLFGFSTEEELRFFKLLTTVSGVGPKTALGALSTADSQTLVSAIVNGDAAYLTKLGGIGKKTAEKIVIELRDKCDGFSIEITTESASGTPTTNMREMEARDALEALGYDTRKTKDLVRRLAQAHDNIQDLIRAALKELN